MVRTRNIFTQQILTLLFIRNIFIVWMTLNHYFPVSYMKRMVNQIGTHQDSPELRKQLHSIQHYTQQLSKDTNGYIKELNALPAAPSQSEQRQRKMQRERLQDEFTSTLNSFQAAQRSAAQKEKEQIDKAKAQVYGDPFAGKILITLVPNIFLHNTQQAYNVYSSCHCSFYRFKKRQAVN